MRLNPPLGVFIVSATTLGADGEACVADERAGNARDVATSISRAIVRRVIAVLQAGAHRRSKGGFESAAQSSAYPVVWQAPRPHWMMAEPRLKRQSATT